MEYIKVNLPASESDYKEGRGEGVFVLVEPDIKQAYDNDAETGSYTGVLDNDSLYYPELKHGETIPFEMRGENRPVTPFNWLFEHYGAAQW